VDDTQLLVAEVVSTCTPGCDPSRDPSCASGCGNPAFQNPPSKPGSAFAWHAEGKMNSETPELYAVHPYRLFTVGRQVAAGVDLGKAIESFRRDPSAMDNGDWSQGVMAAALLGMANTSARLLIDRATMPPGGKARPLHTPVWYYFRKSCLL
jgi:hypothetical protein